MRRSIREDIDELREAMRFVGRDSAELRRRLDSVLMQHQALRRRYHLTLGKLSDAERQNEKLVAILEEAKGQIELLKEEVDKLCAPLNSYGVFQRSNKDGTAEIIVDHKRMRVNVHPNLDTTLMQEG
jgi:proteasome-associated ATPase